jgi:hypothetical protein
VERRSAERRQDRNGAREQDRDRPGQVRPALAPGQVQESDGREQEEDSVVLQQRFEQGREVERQVVCGDRRQEIGPPFGERSEGAVAAHLRRKRSEHPPAGQEPVAQERRHDGRGRPEHRPAEAPRRQGAIPRQMVRQHEQGKEHHLGPCQARDRREAECQADGSRGRGQDRPQHQRGYEGGLHAGHDRPREGVAADHQDGAQDTCLRILRGPLRQMACDERQGEGRRDPRHVGGPRKRQPDRRRQGQEQRPERRARGGGALSRVEGESVPLHEIRGDAGVDPGVVERQARLSGRPAGGEQMKRRQEQDETTEGGGDKPRPSSGGRRASASAEHAAWYARRGAVRQSGAGIAGPDPAHNPRA